jgi:hypothetical protein
MTAATITAPPGGLPFNVITPLGYALSQTPHAVSRPQAATGANIDTAGWDTVFAIPIRYVNKAIVDHKSSPKAFEISEETGLYRCAGRFGAWQVVRGGDGSNIRMALPVSDVSGWFDMSGAKTPYRYGKLTTIIEINLQYIPHTPDAPLPAGGNLKNLIVKDSGGTDTDPVVSIVSTEWHSGAVQPAMARYVIEAALAAWCNASLGEFAHVFSTVNVDRIIDKGQWAFLNPTYTSYAYADAATADDSILGVLCMTDHRAPGKNIQQIDNRTIPSGAQGGFLLSTERLLTDLVLPSLKVHWPDAAPDKFQFDERQMQLKHGRSIDLPPIEHKGEHYTPHLKAFSFSVINQIIEVFAYTEVEVSPGITAWSQSTHWYRIGLGKNKDGQQTLVYQQEQKPAVNRGTQSAPGVKITEIIIGIIGALVIIILGVLTDGAAFIAAAALAGLLFGLAAAAPEIVKLVQDNAAPSVDMLAFNVSAPITWPGGKDFKLNFASLNGSLQLGGDLGFV